MVTRALARQRTYADRWEDCYPSAVLSGIAGDPAHAKRGGYHMSIVDNPRGNYSVTRADDAAPPGKWARDIPAATDMSMKPADMRTDYRRMRAVWTDKTDPRRKYLNAYNGWDGSGDAVRLDFCANTATYATPDHRWHAHEERRRRYVDDEVADDAVLSAHRGETKAQYVARVGRGESTTTAGDDGMNKAELIAALRDPGVQEALAVALGNSTVKANLGAAVKGVQIGFPTPRTAGALLIAGADGHAATLARLAEIAAAETLRDAAQTALIAGFANVAGVTITDAQVAVIADSVTKATAAAGAAVAAQLAELEAARVAAAKAELAAFGEGGQKKQS